MITTTTDVQYEVSYSDNSHLFGIPIRIIEGGLSARMEIERKDLEQWIKRTQDLPIEFHFVYK